MTESIPKAPELETVKIEVEGSLGRLILNRPARLNAINAQIELDITQAARWFDSVESVRVVIVSGAGRAFSAGADLAANAEAQSAKSGGRRYRRNLGDYGLRMMEALEQMRAITIAQVHGYAVGGGFSIVLACDLRIAADDTVFFIPEIDIGVPYGWGTVPRMVREIGPVMTRELIMTCRRFDAHEAKSLGMLNRVVPASGLQAETLELANELSKKPVIPLSITKDHINAVSRAMGSTMTGFADRDLFLASCEDPESVAAAQAYASKVIKRKRSG